MKSNWFIYPFVALRGNGITIHGEHDKSGHSTPSSLMSNRKSSSKKSIWREDGSSPEGSGASTAATLCSAFAEEALQAAVADAASTRVDLRVDVVLCGSRETALAAGLDAEADLVVGRGSELVRDAVDTLGAAMDVRGLDGTRDIVGGRLPSAVVLRSGRMV